jgi:uncharacterized protein with PIN domain
MTLTPSPDPPKLYLNEHLSPRLAVQLRRYGFDVLASQESSMLSEDDSQQLLYAVAERRALVTFNVRDFISLHKRYIAEGREHWGIIFSTEESFSVLLRRLLRLLHTVSATEMKNQVRWLNEFR